MASLFLKRTANAKGYKPGMIGMGPCAEDGIIE
jgi:hypothetical protein